MTVAELIKRLQDSEVRQDAVVDFRAYDYSSSRQQDFRIDDLTYLYVDQGPNAGSWVTLLSEDLP